MRDVCLLAPAVTEYAGIVTRLRRYEQSLRDYGLSVCTYSFSAMSIPLHRTGHTHILDPLTLVQTVLKRVEQGESLDVNGQWWPPVRSDYSVTVTMLAERPERVQERFLEQVLDGAQHIMAPTQHLANELQQRYGILGEKIYVAETPLLGAAKPELQSTSSVEVEKRIVHAQRGEGQILLCASTLSSNRGLESFLRITEQVRYIIPTVCGVLVGPVADTRYAKWLLPQLVRAGVHYIGAVAPQEMPILYKRSSVLLDPGCYTGLSAAVGEALDAQLPVVAIAPHWGESEGPPGLILYQAEGEALRHCLWLLRKSRGLQPHRTSEPSEIAMQLYSDRKRIETETLYKLCTMRSIDGGVSVG